MDEKKTYSIVGRVEIGTDEYRDLIEACDKLRAEKVEESRERYKYYRELEDAKKNIAQLEETVKKLTTYKNYILTYHNDEFRAWCFEQQANDEE